MSRLKNKCYIGIKQQTGYHQLIGLIIFRRVHNSNLKYCIMEESIENKKLIKQLSFYRIIFILATPVDLLNNENRLLVVCQLLIYGIIVKA